MLTRYTTILFGMVMLPFHSHSQMNLSLDGQWEIIFDEENEGRSAGWMQSEIFEGHSGKQTIQVPSCWERYREDYEGVAFYRKVFEVPAEWEGMVIRLQFGAVNYLSEVWLNGEVVGYHEGGFTPFEFRVDEMIKAGKSNVLTLRVVGPVFLSGKEIDGMKALETPQWRGGITGGIWQSVQLVATDAIYIKDVFIEPKISDNSARFQIELDHTGIKDLRAEIEISISEVTNSAEPMVAARESWQLHSGKNGRSLKLTIPNPGYWSPENPHLYRAEVRVKYEGKLSDSWQSRFGMRELTIKDKDFYLNGKRIYVKASFFEGLYPNGIAYPDSEEMARKEIQLAKEAGFNMIRPWRRPPAPMWLDLADELGVLVVGSPALECMQLPFSTPYLPSRVENEVRQAILRDRNRACVVQWELFNELHRPVLKQMMRPMAMLARDLDPTRLILDESGGWAFGANMYLPYQYQPTKFNDIHNYPGPFINKERYEGYLSIGMTKEEKEVASLEGKTPGRNVLPGLMSYVSELGYGSLPDLTVNNEQFRKDGNSLTPAYRYHERIAREQAEVLKQSGFSDLYPDMQKFYLDQQHVHGTANKRMIEAVRANPEVDGYCIHALVAGDWILGAGLLDLWRNPKSYAYEATKAANQPRLLSIRAIPRNIYAEQGTTLQILGVNELDPANATLQIEILSPKGKRVFFKRINPNWETGISQLFQDQVTTKKWKGNYEIQAKMMAADGRILAENHTQIDVFPSQTLTIPRTKVAVLDSEGKVTAFLQASGLAPSTFDATTPTSVPVLVTGHADDLNKDEAAILMKFVRNGGTAVYLEGIKESVTEEQGALPFRTKVHPVVGLWTCIPHLVRRHPVFEGLPSNTMMRDIYENVWARTSLRNLQDNEGLEYKTIVGSIGFDWFSREHKMHYSGPGASWWGADVAEVSLGKGRCIVSQLRLVGQLGKDPVAEKILGNLIRYVAK